MNRKGVCYDTGTVMAFNWRPHFDAKTVRRELEIIKEDLHCNAVRITGRGFERLIVASEAALGQGLEVWFSPLLWEKSPRKTLNYIVKAARQAEELRTHWPDKVVFSVGSELTLFMQGIVPGRTLNARIKNPAFLTTVKAGGHNKPLNQFLASANASVRQVFHGKVVYASLVWEAVDWGLFDFVGIDHYRISRIEDKYVEMLKPAFEYKKPVEITEFGYSTSRSGIGSEGLLSTSGLEGGIIDIRSQFFHQLPLIGRLIKPKTKGTAVRDEHWQATKLIETLEILEKAGVDGVFISNFISQITPYSDNPRYDLDMASTSLVKYYDDGKHGETYADMPWEPKEAFRAVAEYYAKH